MAAVSSRGGTFLGIDPINLGDELSESSCVSTNESDSDSLEDYDSCDEGMPAYPPSTASTSCTYVDALDWHDVVEFRASGQSDAIEGYQRGIRCGLESPTFDATLGLPDVPPNDRFFPYTQFDQEKNWRSMLSQQKATGVAKHLNAEEDPYKELQRRYKASSSERKEWDADRKAAISSHLDMLLGIKKPGKSEQEQEESEQKLSQQSQEGKDGHTSSQKESEDKGKETGARSQRASENSGGGEEVVGAAENVSPSAAAAGTHDGEAGIGKFLSTRGFNLDGLVRGGSQEAVGQKETDEERGRLEAGQRAAEIQKRRLAAQLTYQEEVRKAVEAMQRQALEEAKERERQEAAERQKALEEQREAEIRSNEAARQMAARQAELRAAEARRQQEQQEEQQRRALAAAADARKREEAVQSALAPPASIANIFPSQSPSSLQQLSVADQQRGVSQPAQSSIPQPAVPTHAEPSQSSQSTVMLHESESAKQFEAVHKQRSEMFKERIGPFGSDPAFKKNRRVLDKQLKMEINQVSGNLQQVYQKAERIIKVLDGLPEDQRFYSYKSLAQIMMSKCDGLMQNLVFPLAEVLMKVVRKHPLLLDALLSALHKVCVLTVPKYFSLQNGLGGDAERRELMNYKQIEEGTGSRMETEDEFVARQSGYIMLFAGLLQVDDGKNSSGVNEAWMYLARLLNELPPTRVTATALENFLRIAGSKLFYQYQNQMVKLLQFIDSHFLKKLGESGEVEVRAIYTRLHTYLSTEKFREEPEGWRMPERDESSFTQA